MLGWAAFFVGITATSFGSAYYHLNPNDARLVWDRLPVCLYHVVGAHQALYGYIAMTLFSSFLYYSTSKPSIILDHA